MLRDDLHAAAGQTQMLCFALQADLQLCTSIRQGCASENRNREMDLFKIRDDIHLCAFCEERNKCGGGMIQRQKRETRSVCVCGGVITVSTATTCRPLRKGGAAGGRSCS